MFQVGFLPTLPSLLTQPHTPLIHRDLSWLQFNERVLSESRDINNPLLERVKFLAISSSNLDEFFAIRLASLGRSIASQGRTDQNAAKRLIQIRASILENVTKFVGKQADAFERLLPELEAADIFITRQAKEGEPGFEIGKKVFDEQILPHLSAPESFSVSKISNLENLQMAAIFKGDQWFKIPKTLPAVLSHVVPVEVKKRTRIRSYYFFLDDLIATHLPAAFRLEGAWTGMIRLTRDGDFTVDLEEEDPESIPDIVRSGLGSRERGRPVRLQYWGGFSDSFLAQSLKALRLISGQVIEAPGTHCLQGLWALLNQNPEATSTDRPLKFPPLESLVPSPFKKGENIFNHLKRKDILLHHPYDSFDAFVSWIQTACSDEAVKSIEVTVYRMDALSPVISSLKTAALTKKVRVIIELRARFDELNNLRLADELRKAGVEVAFGFGKLKLHAKIALVTRVEDGSEKLYTHLSTGNYNAATARQYTDLAILSAKPEIGQDARVFFDAIWNGQVPMSFKQIVSAPARLHRRLLTHIQEETEAAKKGQKARIVAKVNALVDDSVIENLYLASNAGVQVDLIVRGACSLVPGIRGLSENIRVISIVDRFLEHSRIYYFGSSKIMYLSSADWMPRNFFSRLEIAFPVLDPDLYRYLEEIVIPAYLSDTVKARQLTSSGTWKRRTLRVARSQITPALKKLYEIYPSRSQFLFEELARQHYRGTPLEKIDRRE